MARIFVSHASQDAEQSKALFSWLRSKGHTEAFLDFDKDAGIQPGADWERTLYREIERSQAVILLLTSHWMASKWCFVEFAQARALGKAIFPVIETPAGESLVGRDLQQIDLTADRDNGLERLSRALSDIALTSAEGFALPEGVLPFPGFDALGEEHAAVIFGRDDDLARLIERVRKARTQGGTRLMFILGASGAGKSSLLRAGLVPRLRRDARNWIVLPTFRPETAPFDRLVRCLVMSAAPGNADSARAERAALRSALTANPPERALATIAANIREHAGQLDASILLAVDQAEELFTIASQEARDRFFALSSMLVDEGLPFHVVATLRSEFLGALQHTDALTASFDHYSLPPLPVERIGALVRGPARLAGLQVEDSLVSALMADAQSADALPLIAFTLRRLYDREHAGGALTEAGYRSLGDADRGLSPLDNVVRQAADQALPRAGRTDADDQALKSAFIPHLVSVNGDGAYVRRPARQNDLPVDALRDIDRLVEARLLVRRAEGTATESSGGTVIEVAHEALFRVWDRLAEWLTDEQDFLVGKQRIEQAHQDWLALPEHERDKGLLSGVLLERARVWLLDRPQAFKEARELQFLHASIARDDKHKAEAAARQRRTTRLAVAAALVFAVVGGLAAWQWNAAETAQQQAEAALVRADTRLDELLRFKSESLARDAFDRLDAGTYDDALLLALGSVGPADEDWPATDESRAALTAALLRAGDSQIPPLATLKGHAGTVFGGAFSPDDRHAVTWSLDGEAILWDVESAALVRRFDHGDSIAQTLFSADGNRIVTVGMGKSANIWDAATGALSGTVEHEQPIVGARVLTGRNGLLSWGHDGIVRLTPFEGGNALSYEMPYEVLSVSVTEDETSLIVAGGTVAVLSLDDFSPRYELSKPVENESNPRFDRTAILPNGEWAAWSNSGRLLVGPLDEISPRIDADLGAAVFGVVPLFEEGLVLAWTHDAITVFDRESGARTEIANPDDTIMHLHRASGMPAVIWGGFDNELHAVSLDGKMSAEIQLTAPIERMRSIDLDGVMLVAQADGVVTALSLTAADDGTLQFQRMASHEHAAPANNLAISGDIAFTGGEDGKLEGWHIRTGLVVGAATHAGHFRNFAFSNRRLLTWGLDPLVKVWGWGARPNLTRVQKTDKRIFGYDVDRQSGQIAAWTEDGIEVYGTSSDDSPLRVEANFTPTGVSLDAQTDRLAAWNAERLVVCRLNPPDCEEVALDAGPIHTEFSNGELHILTSAGDLVVFDPRGGQTTQQLGSDPVPITTTAAIGTPLTFAGSEKTVIFFESAPPRLLDTAQLRDDDDRLASNITLSSSGNRAFVNWYSGRNARIIALDSGTAIAIDHSVISAYALSEEALFLGTPAGTIMVIDPADGRVLETRDLGAEALELIPLEQGRLFALVGGESGRNSGIVFDRNGATRTHFTVPLEHGSAVAVGARIVTYGQSLAGRTLAVFDSLLGRMLLTSQYTGPDPNLDGTGRLVYQRYQNEIRTLDLLASIDTLVEVARAVSASLASLDRPTMCRLTALSGSECAEAISEFVEAPRRDLVSYANANEGVGNLTDLLAGQPQLRPDKRLDVEIAVRTDAKVAFFHSLPFRDDIAQFSMFDSTGIVAVVAKDGTRRTLGLPVNDAVRTLAVNSREALMILLNDDGEAVQGYYLPMLHYR